MSVNRFWFDPLHNNKTFFYIGKEHDDAVRGLLEYLNFDIYNHLSGSSNDFDITVVDEERPPCYILFISENNLTLRNMYLSTATLGNMFPNPMLHGALFMQRITTLAGIL